MALVVPPLRSRWWDFVSSVPKANMKDEADRAPDLLFTGDGEAFNVSISHTQDKGITI